MSVRRPRQMESRREPSRYDLLLWLMPVPLLIGALLVAVTPLPEPVGIGAGSLPSALLLGYALFVAAPTVERR